MARKLGRARTVQFTSEKEQTLPDLSNSRPNAALRRKSSLPIHILADQVTHARSFIRRNTAYLESAKITELTRTSRLAHRRDSCFTRFPAGLKKPKLPPASARRSTRCVLPGYSAEYDGGLLVNISYRRAFWGIARENLTKLRSEESATHSRTRLIQAMTSIRSAVRNIMLRSHMVSIMQSLISDKDKDDSSDCETSSASSSSESSIIPDDECFVLRSLIQDIESSGEIVNASYVEGLLQSSLSLESKLRKLLESCSAQLSDSQELQDCLDRAFSVVTTTIENLKNKVAESQLTQDENAVAVLQKAQNSLGCLRDGIKKRRDSLLPCSEVQTKVPSHVVSEMEPIDGTNFEANRRGSSEKIVEKRKSEDAAIANIDVDPKILTKAIHGQPCELQFEIEKRYECAALHQQTTSLQGVVDYASLGWHPLPNISEGVTLSPRTSTSQHRPSASTTFPNSDLPSSSPASTLETESPSLTPTSGAFKSEIPRYPYMDLLGPTMPDRKKIIHSDSNSQRRLVTNLLGQLQDCNRSSVEAVCLSRTLRAQTHKASAWRQQLRT